MIARLVGWIMERLGLTLGDEQDVSPACATCSHRYDEHYDEDDVGDTGSDEAPCHHDGCTCLHYVPDWPGGKRI